MSDLTGKRVLVTGGCGSIGSILTERILLQDPEYVRLFDSNEQGLFSMRNEHDDKLEKLRFLIGDIRDYDRLRMAMEDIDVVFHAAALKHVTLNEYNPFEAVRTNVNGTQNVIRAALEENVDSFVGISTDKASNPTSVMGATKLLSERLTIAANSYKGGRDISFGCVRFGNVALSNGSVIPLFVNQIREGGPITVTDPEMTRFIMPTQRAVGLVLEAEDRIDAGEIFILKMPAFQLGDLAEVVRDEFAPEFGYEPSDIDIEIIGPKPGERYHEKLISKDESRFIRELDEMYALDPQIDFRSYEASAEQRGDAIDGEVTSADVELLSRDDIRELIYESKGTIL